jgi:anti-sigma regulatory factor (Ser/Thr protein kinase)
VTRSPLSDTTVVLVQTDDRRGARLREALTSRPGVAVVGEVSTTMGAVSLARRLQPDGLVMDAGLLDIAGHEVLRSVRAVSPDTRIFLHAHASETDVDDAAGSARWFADLVDAVVQPVREAALEARLVLPGAASSVPDARSFITEVLVEWDLEVLVDACALVVSELVANAVRHVPGPCALEISHHSGALRLAVADTGPGMPDLQVLVPTHENGRGLHIVSAFSDAWGIDQLPDGGKLVWAELTPKDVAAR